MISPTQWKLLQSYVISEDTTDSMRQKVNHILFQRHIPFVYGMTHQFRNVHYRKSKNINKEDMLAYAYKGLYDAVKKYNGKYLFVNYAKLHVNGALYKALTEHNQISVLSKHQRRKKVQYIDHNYYALRKNVYLQKKDSLLSTQTSVEETIETIDIYMEKWKTINQFPPFVRRCFHFRFDFYFNCIRVNKEVADLMCCKEEWVRRNIANYITLLTSNYNHIYIE